MKKARFLILTVVLFCFQPASYAQNNDNKSSDILEVNAGASDQMRPGMKIMKVGGINMMVPEGTKFYKQGAQVKMEEASEYSARRFKEMDERLSKIDDRIMKVENANEDAARISREIDARLKKTEVANEDAARISNEMSARLTNMEKKERGMNKKIKELLARTEN